MAGYKSHIGLRPASIPSLHCGVAISNTAVHLPPSSPASLFRRRVRLVHPIADLGVLHLNSWVFGSGKRSVLPRCSLQEVSTAAKEGLRFADDAVSREDDSTVSGVSDLAESADKEDVSSLDWLAQWYPVGLLRDMDERQPYATVVLGRDLVIWWDRSGVQWQVFADVCPHRQAPLSEGRINEQGHLQCSYHGWAFAPVSGACTLIPQAPLDKLQVKDSKRACAKVYHSKQHQGLLWVYMDTSEGAEERAAANPPPFIPELSDPDFVYDIFASEVSYSYDILMENILDPAHVPFAHHKLQGNRNAARPLDFRVEEFGKAGFSGSDVKPGVVSDRQRFQKFIAPISASFMYTFPPSRPPRQGHPWALKLQDYIMSKRNADGSPVNQIGISIFCTPMVPGKSKLYAAFPRNFGKFVHHWTPRWWAHQARMKILDSDMYILHLLERRFEDGGGEANIEKLYYTPTASDVYVMSFRRWLGKFGGPVYGQRASDRLPPSEPKTKLLDRYSLHVINCNSCSRALHKLKAIEIVLHVLPFLLVGLVAVSNVKSLRNVSSFGVPLICIAVASSLASRWLSHWIKKHFEYHGYNHALVK